MPLLPLVPNILEGSAFLVPPTHERQTTLFSCQFCGFDAAGWQVPFQDPETGKAGSSCVLCSLVLRLDRPRIDEELALIWLPEMSQAAVNAVARSLHGLFFAHGEAPSPALRPHGETARMRAAWFFWQSLLQRQAIAKERFGSDRPSDIGQVLASVAPLIFNRRSKLLSGLRLLPLGHVYQGGQDHYPRLLASYLKTQKQAGQGIRGTVETVPSAS
ncbi:hypothetical protein [Beijerinckia indica]|uniref:Uncharacterized protein n=1 Tax=Beijerinckia indica subsp. indica (strain ATCC 9039 / DSM 1715 / NCIMB 8712) TaxID=395963 RepID=B2ILJ8_BEII9|nr:hypothetical protein [Beijerinckia indica]ACB97398.1 hypothetical protein Bind_3869 [Beijerinckia indica subsp. indica ATCC 9039]